MTGSGLFDFLISIIGLLGIGFLLFYAIDFISQEEQFKKIAKTAVGVVMLIIFLIACKAVLFGGAALLAFTPVSLIEFAIGLIVLLVVLYIVYRVLDYFAGSVPFAAEIKYVIGAIALIALLVLAEKALFGGGLGFIHNIRGEIGQNTFAYLSNVKTLLLV